MDETDLVDLYLKEIRDSQPLSGWEEVELARRIKAGDDSALEKLVYANLRFVIDVAKIYQNKGLHMSVLIAEGNYGLIEAARRFDETRGFKFITYAVWWIRQSIQKALRENRNVRRPSNRLSAASKARRVYGDLSVLLGRDPTDEEVAEELEIKVRDVKEAYLATRQEISLDAPFDDEDMTLYDLLAVEESVDPTKSLEYDELKEDVYRMLDKLDERESTILRYHFGFDGRKPMNLQQIGDKMGLTRERIRQIRKRAYTKLRNQDERLKDEITY